MSLLHAPFIVRTAGLDLPATAGPGTLGGMDVSTTPDGTRSRYRRIAETLAGEVRGLRPGERLPSELDLAARFAVNRHTIRHAIDVLVADGLVARRHGYGTVALDRPLPYAIGSQTRFTANVEALGHVPDSRLLRIATVPADPEAAAHLELPAGAPCVRIDTLRIVDARPFSLTAHWLPAPRFAWVAGAYAGGSLHALLAERGVRLRRALTLVVAAAAAPDEATELLLPRHQPLLRVTSVNRDLDGRPVEHAVARIRGDRIALTIAQDSAQDGAPASAPQRAQEPRR